MAAQPEPNVKKTKKVSYKPLSQLNEDRLNELQRMERPENTARVFYYGLEHKARLRQNVNVWFRDHHHCLSLLQRQQRAVQHQMGRLQHDVRRVRREEYKRRQEEIRTKLTRLQVRLLQRRVIERFQSNAMTKMAARGEQSLVALRMTGQKSDHVTPHEFNPGASTLSATLPHSSGETSAGVMGREELGPSERGVDPLDTANNQNTQAHPDRRKSEPSLPSSKKSAGRGGDLRDSNGEVRSGSGAQKTQTQKQKSMRRFSEGDVNKEVDEDSVSFSTRAFAVEDLLNPPTSSKSNNIDIIPEDAPVTKDPDDSLEESTPSLQNQNNIAKVVSKEYTSRTNSRVLEVRKHRPRSPKTHKITRPRRATLATLPQTSKLKTLSPIVPNSSQTSRPHHQRIGSSPSPDSSPLTEIDIQMQNLEKDLTGMDTNSQNDTKSVTKNCKEKESQKVEPTPQHPKEANKATEKDKKKDMNKEAKTDTVSDTEPSPEQGVFSHVPSRAKVMEDVGMMLGEEEEEEEGLLWKGGRQGVKGLPSLAARISQQRKREAKRRSQLLDREPMVQYCRSVRGTLEPLLSEPTRKSFPFPSGRAQYEQNKTLREELQKDVDRKQEINSFFNDLFNRQTEPPKPPAQETTKTAAKMVPMNALLQIRQKGQASRRTSIQQLAACQYLRLHDWEAKNRKDRDKEPVASSWAIAEKELKAGFLALDFTGNS